MARTMTVTVKATSRDVAWCPESIELQSVDIIILCANKGTFRKLIPKEMFSQSKTMEHIAKEMYVDVDNPSLDKLFWT